MAKKTKKKLSHLTLVVGGSALLLLSLPDAAFARGGGGGGPGRGGGTVRSGPAGRGTVGRGRTRASGRGDIIRDGESGGDQSHSSADTRREKEEARKAEQARKDAAKAAAEKAKKEQRWQRRRGGRSYTVAEFEKLKCGRVERVGGVSYFNCDGTWFEKVFEGGAVRWVEVEQPA